MTVSTTAARTILAGNGSATTFAFSFPITAAADLVVTKVSSAGVETTLTITTHYTVSVSSFPGSGSVSYPVSGSPLATGESLVIQRTLGLTQSTDLQNQGSFFAETHETAFDRLTMLDQQEQDAIDRSLKAPVGDPTTINMQLPAKADRLGKYLAFNVSTGNPEAGASSDDVATLAAVTSDIATLADIEDGTDATDAIQTVAGIASNVTTVAGISANVTTVAADGSDIGTVAGISSNVTTVAGVAANVTTVAGISSNVTTVAGIASNVTAVAGDATDIGAVAAVADEVGRLGTSAAVADLAILGTSAIVTDMDLLATSANVTAMGLLGTSANVTAMGLLGVSGVITDMGILGTTATVSDLSDVADIAANVTTVAGIAANVTTVAGISSNVTTVAGISSNVTTVAGISSNVTTVAGIASDVTAVAGDATDIGAVAAKATEIGRLGTSAATEDLANLGGAATVTDLANLGDSAADLSTLADIASDISSVAAQAIGFTFSTTTTMSDPGSAGLRFNHGTIASCTAIAIDDLDTSGADVSPYIITFDDSSDTNKGTLLIRKGGAASTFAIFTITALVDNSGWSQLTVSHVASNGTFSNSDKIFVEFARTGAAGSGAMDNFVISDGATTQTIADGNTVTFVDGAGINVAVSATDTVTISSTTADPVAMSIALG